MKVIICGSMSASKEMIEVGGKLSDLGYEIILPAFTHEYATMETIDKMHTESARNKVEHDLIKGYFDEIRNTDVVLIVNTKRKNIPGYIGGNTFLEMGFAFVLNKPIYLLHQIPDIGYKDEIEAMRPIILNGDLSQI